MSYRVDSWQFSCTHNVQGITPCGKPCSNCWAWDRRSTPALIGHKAEQPTATAVGESDEGAAR